jgi:hypothetical protein
MDPQFEGQMSARLVKVTQAAVDATASAYAMDANLPIEQRLRAELGQRGINVTSDEWLADQADVVRTGRPIRTTDPSLETGTDDDPGDNDAR